MTKGIAFILAEAWGERADKQYQIYKDYVAAPALFKSYVPMEARIEFDYAREWYEFWSNQFKLDSTPGDTVQ